MVFTVAEWLVAHAQEHFGDDIALIAYYGSHARGTATPTSDLDLFYIPDDGKARTLSTQFVYDGLPYDFWPISWRFLEEVVEVRTSRPWSLAAGLLADSRVLYTRSSTDLERFLTLQQQLRRLCEPAQRTALQQRALSAFPTVRLALDRLRQTAIDATLSSQRQALWQLAESLVECVALFNQTYFARSGAAAPDQLDRLAEKPEQFRERLSTLLAPGNVTAERWLLAETLADDVRQLLLSGIPTEPLSPELLFTDFYFFVVEYCHKITSACQRGDRLGAERAALLLQEELAGLVAQTTGPAPTAFQRLSEYDATYQARGFPDLIAAAQADDLTELAQAATQLQSQVAVWLTEQNVPLHVYDTPATFAAFLQNRVNSPAD